MKVEAKMVYLGFETKSSKKSGNEYLLVKAMEVENSAIFEFYVPTDKLLLITTVGQLQPFTPIVATLNIRSYNSKPDVDLDAVAPVSALKEVK